jgi:hypothetical protein
VEPNPAAAKARKLGKIWLKGDARTSRGLLLAVMFFYVLVPCFIFTFDVLCGGGFGTILVLK